MRLLSVSQTGTQIFGMYISRARAFSSSLFRYDDNVSISLFCSMQAKERLWDWVGRTDSPLVVNMRKDLKVFIWQRVLHDSKRWSALFTIIIFSSWPLLSQGAPGVPQAAFSPVASNILSLLLTDRHTIWFSSWEVHLEMEEKKQTKKAPRLVL